MTANLVQSATYLANLMQIYMQLQIWLHIFSTSSLSALPAVYSRLSGHCLKMRVKHWSWRSSPVAWTTAIVCF